MGTVPRFYGEDEDARDVPVLTIPCVFLLYNSSALLHVWVAVIPALAGGLLGALREKFRK